MAHGVEHGHAGHGRLNRLLERSWPIADQLKKEKSEKLFSWIGACVSQVVGAGCDAFALPADKVLPMGVTFSFPMEQRSLSEANLMVMGKGFSLTSNLDLGGHLLKGYEEHRAEGMPPIAIAAISNDAVSTLVSFMYLFQPEPHQKAVMAFIVGTGTNATIPLKLSSLHKSKRPASIRVMPGQDGTDVRIAVNTEWSINGSAPPLRKLGLISRWDDQLDGAGEHPGFQPLEYMVSGRYLGELARLIFLDYMETRAGIRLDTVPGRLHRRFGLSSAFISHLYPGSAKGALLDQLEAEFPATEPSSGFAWTQDLATALYRIALSIERRAAGIMAASIVGLLTCADEIPPPWPAGVPTAVTELAVGYTGGCIQYFQNYRADCQAFIDSTLEAEFHGAPPVRVRLRPCHDGGITGAGILVPAAMASRETGTEWDGESSPGAGS